MKTITLLVNCVGSLSFLLSICLNVLGCYLLAAGKRLNNSKIVLMNLACSQVVVALIQLVYNCMRALTHPENMSTIDNLAAASWVLYHLAMLSLTIDRLISIRFLLKYRVIVTEKRLIQAIMASWILAIILAIPFFLSRAWFDAFKHYVWIVIDVIFIILCLVTYGLIFLKTLEIRRFHNDQQEMRMCRRKRFIFHRNRKLIKIVALIIVSFVIFTLLPDIIFHFYPIKNQIVFELLSTSWSINLISCPLIYILLQDDLKLLLKSKCCKLDDEEAIDHQDTAF